VVLEVIPGTGCGLDYGSDCAVEVSDRNRCMEDAYGDILPGVFSFGEDPVY